MYFSINHYICIHIPHHAAYKKDKQKFPYYTPLPLYEVVSTWSLAGAVLTLSEVMEVRECVELSRYDEMMILIPSGRVNDLAVFLSISPICFEQNWKQTTSR